MMIPIQLYPFIDRLRGDPRYVALLRKMRLTPSESTARASGQTEAADGLAAAHEAGIVHPTS